MSEKDVVMTYESLFEILQLEKKREELQALDPDFYRRMLAYLCDKRQHFESKASQQLLFERDEKEKARLELENVKKMLKDIYDRREKKIMNMALNKSKSGISLVNMSSMLPSEQSLFNSINSTLSEFRKESLFKLVSGHLPCNNVLVTINSGNTDDGSSCVSHIDVPQPLFYSNDSSVSNAGSFPMSDESDGSVHGHFASHALSGPSKEPEQAKELKTTHFLNQTAANIKKVRFLAPIEEIIGPDLEIYGPYESGAIKELPKEIASVLMQKKQAEEV